MECHVSAFLLERCSHPAIFLLEKKHGWNNEQLTTGAIVQLAAAGRRARHWYHVGEAQQLAGKLRDKNLAGKFNGFFWFW